MEFWRRSSRCRRRCGRGCFGESMTQQMLARDESDQPSAGREALPRALLWTAKRTLSKGIERFLITCDRRESDVHVRRPMMSGPRTALVVVAITLLIGGPPILVIAVLDMVMGQRPGIGAFCLAAILTPFAVLPIIARLVPPTALAVVRTRSESTAGAPLLTVRADQRVALCTNTFTVRDAAETFIGQITKTPGLARVTWRCYGHDRQLRWQARCEDIAASWWAFVVHAFLSHAGIQPSDTKPCTYTLRSPDSQIMGLLTRNPRGPGTAEVCLTAKDAAEEDPRLLVAAVALTCISMKA